MKDFSLETFYMFGDNKYDEWSDFLTEYTPPPFTLPRPQLAWMVIGMNFNVEQKYNIPHGDDDVHKNNYQESKSSY